MNSFKINVSETYKKAQKKSAVWIALFLITLFFSTILSIIIFIICVCGGIAIVIAKPMWITIFLGLGLLALGGLIVYYNIKFILNIFKKTATNGIEIFETDQPELFKLIKATADKVGTKHPKKVFIIDDVNAYVSYSNNLQSLVFPTRKNLSIGVGLLHGISQNELKGIIAHEFGHFSQKSMTIGSHVGNATKIMEDILYSNQTLKFDVDNLGQINGIVGFISMGAVAYNKMIESILKIIHKKLEFNYLKLSREMEFHADQIATNVVGIETMSKPLLRIELYQFVYQELANFYTNLQDDKKFSTNIYQNMNQLVDFYIDDYELFLENNLAIVGINEFNQNHSLLQFEDLWSTHPEMDKRLANIASTNHHSEIDKSPKAITLLQKNNEFEEEFTFNFFFQLNLYRVNEINNSEFIETFKTIYNKYNYPKVYNHFFTNYDLPFDRIKEVDLTNKQQNIPTNELFSDENILVAKQYLALQIDLLQLDFFTGQKKPQPFKYNNVVYNKKQDVLKVKEELEQINKEKEAEFSEYLDNIKIFFKSNLDEQKTILLEDCIKVEADLSANIQLVNEIRTHINFATKPIHEKLRIEALTVLNNQIEQLKNVTKDILQSEIAKEKITIREIENAQYFIDEDWIFFFDSTGYNNNAFENLIENLYFVDQVSNNLLFQKKAAFLKEYEPLLDYTSKTKAS
ncbi:MULTISPECIES: M48 family metalloprotease [Empedobacter]|uniref:M48 family metalloprotease n=2 Tax=Weeksellaceae TaxID=2762318 RepID=UPI001C8F18BD|nr:MULTISPECIES: M48 family metallopeptidase [Empedobacter]MBY0066998.1 M48 family metalloprotease [Empedobacter falsenii]MDM1137608.1 M48 family metalloprotease [Empedobacter sp. R132-2]